MPTKLLADRLELSWNGVEGHFFEPQNNLVTFDPSTCYNTKPALFIKKEYLLKFLNVNKLRIVWIMMTEKREMGAHLGLKYTGRQVGSGVFTLDGNDMIGELNLRYESPTDEE